MRFERGLLPSALVVACCACVTANFKEPISDFQKAIDASGGAIAAYYTGLNDFERDVYLEDRAADGAEVLAIDAGGKPTPLLSRTFSAESIRARTDAVALLGVFAARLGALAGSDAPDRFENASRSLGENISGLQKTFAELSNDRTASNYAGPIGSLVGAVGKMILESKREGALVAAIEDGAPAADNILVQLDRDLSEVIGPLRTTGLKQVLATRVNEYNQRRSGLSPAQRRQALAELRRAAMDYETAVTQNPAELVSGMREALRALVVYARSERKPQNLAEMNAAIEVFRARVEQITSALDQMKKRRQE